MPEQEIKLHVPAGARSAVEKEIKQRDAERVRMRALYFDTPGRELARARVAVRLRQEGRSWVQTLKTPGENAISKIEINHPRPGPVLDLSVYAGTPVEPALTGLKGELGVRYETDVVRLLRKVRTRGGTVEIAFDTGRLKAGGLELPISEIEFELVSGKLSAVFALARRWQQRHGLVLDARSKSERGDALAQAAQDIADAGEPGTPEANRERAERIARFWAPRNAAPVVLSPDMTPAAALDAVTAECLDQIVRNATILAEADTAGVYRAGGPEHVHQLRVGIRRLRSAWRLFEGLTELPPPALRDEIRAHFAALGASRDADVLQDTILPRLRAAGMPDVALPTADAQDAAPDALAGARAFQGWALDLQAWHLCGERSGETAEVAPPSGQDDETAAEDAPEPTIIPLQAAAARPPANLRALLAQRLRKWHKRVQREGARFSHLDIEVRHELRKRAKRLRYGLSFAESLLPDNRLRAYRKQLAKVQDVLGEFNDLAVAQERFQALAAQRPEAWFALGWIAARLDDLAAQAERTFAELARAREFWK